MAQVATPVITPESGVQTGYGVEITCATAGATIRYQITSLLHVPEYLGWVGDDPTIKSPVYSAKFNSGTNVIIKARAWKTGMEPSAIVKVTYIRNPFWNRNYYSAHMCSVMRKINEAEASGHFYLARRLSTGPDSTTAMLFGIHSPSGLGRRFYYVDRATEHVWVYTEEGSLIHSWDIVLAFPWEEFPGDPEDWASYSVRMLRVTTSADVHFRQTIGVDSQGDVYVAYNASGSRGDFSPDCLNNRRMAAGVQRYTAAGNPVKRYSIFSADYSTSYEWYNPETEKWETAWPEYEWLTRPHGAVIALYDDYLICAFRRINYPTKTDYYAKPEIEETPSQLIVFNRNTGATVLQKQGDFDERDWNENYSALALYADARGIMHIAFTLGEVQDTGERHYGYCFTVRDWSGNTKLSRKNENEDWNYFRSEAELDKQKYYLIGPVAFANDTNDIDPAYISRVGFSVAGDYVFIPVAVWRPTYPKRFFSIIMICHLWAEAQDNGEDPDTLNWHWEECGAWPFAYEIKTPAPHISYLPVCATNDGTLYSHDATGTIAEFALYAPTAWKAYKSATSSVEIGSFPEDESLSAVKATPVDQQLYDVRNALEDLFWYGGYWRHTPNTPDQSTRFKIKPEQAGVSVLRQLLSTYNTKYGRPYGALWPEYWRCPDLSGFITCDLEMGEIYELAEWLTLTGQAPVGYNDIGQYRLLPAFEKIPWA